MAYQVIGQPTTSEEFDVYLEILHEVGVPIRRVRGQIGLVSQRGIADQIVARLNARLPNMFWTVRRVDVDARELCVSGRCVDIATGEVVYTLSFDPTDPEVRPWSDEDSSRFPNALKEKKTGESAFVNKQYGDCWIC